MGSLSPVPELKCMDPENYGKYFQEICWNSSSTRKSEKKPPKKGGKKEKLRKNKSFSTHAACFAPTLLANPSQFAVYATVRQSILQRWRHLQEGVSEVSDDSDIEETTSVIPISKLPKITGIGLRTVFALISQARFTDSNFCEQSLSALLDVLQGHAPEELSQEPSEIIINLHSMLAEVASGVTEARPDQRGRPEIPTPLTALGSSCLISLSVARGEAELILSAVSTLIISAPSLSDQYIQVPSNLTTLQRSVQSVLLGNSSRNQWLNYGVPQQALFGTCPVEMPAQWTIGTGELVLRSLCSDGCYLYVFTSRGLIKIGSGYGSSIKQHTYLFKGDFFAIDRHGWLGYCKNKLYVRVGRKKTEVFEVDKDTLEIRNVLRLDPGTPAPVEHKSAVFTDGNQLGLMMLTNFDSLTIRMYSVDNIPPRTDGSGIVTLTSKKELNVHLLRRRTLALGRAPFDDNMSRRTLELDAPVAMQLDDNEEDPLMSICGGQDFGLLTTMSGKVYYTGKGASLGYKSASPSTGRWTLMKETLFTRNEAPNAKKAKVIQVAVGHEGAHAILVLDNGTALFTGIARRGEDGDGSKHRRTPKPTRPKKMFKVEGHHVVYAACNYGSTALVTRQGLLLMFGKDTQHCDSTGLVIGLKHERVIQVALGKAHAAALTNFGQVYTFGINNKGQCGREFGYTKEKSCSSSRKSNNKEDVRICQTNHTWKTDYCRVCVLCRECTGFSNACHCTHLPNRIPGEKCGCGEGDSGCSVCGACRRCADTFAAAAKPDCNAADDDDADGSTRSETRSDKETSKYMQYEEHTGPETERDASLKVSCLPPARVSIPGGHRVAGVACGLHHTVILTEHGEVLTFGSNQYGQLGAGDVLTHHRIVRVRVPRASFVAAGSNHTAILTREGELYTFGNYQNGCLGRPRIEDTGRSDRCPIWYATPHRVPRLGPRFSCKAVWVSASGDQTFVQVSQSLIKTETLFSCTITANSNCIVILPNRPEHSFKCITINKADGTCKAWTGPEQVDFVNTLACLDPLYDVFWCYQPQMRVMKCYNILAFDSKNILGCFNHEPDFANDNDLEYPNYGFFRRLEDFKNLHTFDFSCNKGDQNDNVALSNVSVLNQELAIPTTPGFLVTRMHAALYLLGCLDSLTYAHDTKLNNTESKRERTSSPVAPVKEDFLTVNRFESHGGGWGYSGHSVEAIRFMCDTDILLGGFGLFGGRGDYTAKIKLFDIGPEGGDQEGDGELIAESDEIVYECAPRDRFPVLFESPVQLVANRWYVAWACINGPSSDCGSSGQAMVINDDIAFQFKTSKKSNNGTDVNAGQIPSLLYNAVSPDHLLPTRKIDSGEPVIPLSKNISRKVTVPCFRSLISLLLWSWTTFQQIMLETNGLLPINFHKVMTMKHQKRLVYIIRASLRLVKSYILEIYPQHSRRRNSQEFMSFLDAIAEVRNVIQGIMADPIPTCSMLPKKPGKNKVHRVCYVQFALEMTNSILAEAHETFTACFYAFFPTPILKWSHLCSLLFNVRDGIVSPSQIRELTATSSAMCASRSLRDVLQYIVPVTQGSINLNENRRPDSKLIKDIPTKSATVPRSSHGQKPPPVPPRANSRDSKDPTVEKQDHTEWHLLDVVPRLLDIIMNPIKQQILIRQCGQPHDHGEIKQQARLSEFCCKLIARIIAEMTHSATNIKEELDTSAVKPLTTPSRFMRVNQSRAWNTGNGSPDAICFTVDRPGVVLVGICVYGGLGNYEYSLELLHDVRQLRSVADETVAAHCWVSVEVAHGAFCASDCQHDTVQLKFDKPIPLKEDLRYALRLCNHGGRTANGDCGLPSVKGPDGTTFRFSSCSLSFNGTTLARGQIPSLIYYGTSKSLHSNSESADALVSTLRAITLRVASIVIDSSANLFCSLRNELTPEDLRRNANALQQSHAINSLIPFTLANLSELDDSKSVIKLLDMIHKLLPHVAAMNLLIPVNEDVITTPSCFYTWVESDHPYKQATVTNMRVLFPASVSWIVLEMDPRSVTAQPEDTLTVYAYSESSGSNCHCNSEVRTAAPPFRKVYKRLVQLTSDGEVEELDDEDVPCMHYNCRYYSVTPKLSNVAADWPQKALLIPGSEVIFSLETASDYLNEYNKSNNEENRFGFRCLCIGYEDTPMTSQRQGLPALEMELIYAGAACASRLLAPDLDIPSLSFSTIVDVQVQAMIGSSPTSNEGESSQDPIESLLMSRGLELSSPPTIHQVLDGQPLLRSVSTERQFLSDFVAGAESTAGGRLARWLAPTSRVEPSKCELKLPLTPVKPGTRVSLPVVVRDQYGEVVASPALRVEVVVQRLEENAPHTSRAFVEQYFREGVPDAPYQPTVRDTMCFQAITMMKAYQNYSFEELRLASGTWSDIQSGVSAFSSNVMPADRLQVRTQPDGSYVAVWMPRAPGTYHFRCTLDDRAIPQDLTLNVAENTSDGAAESSVTGGGLLAPSMPSKLRRFSAKYSAGLRVRASPSLQAEEIGKVPPGGNIAFAEEVRIEKILFVLDSPFIEEGFRLYNITLRPIGAEQQRMLQIYGNFYFTRAGPGHKAIILMNKDGTWVRLTAESVSDYADGSPDAAWCLQHHRHLDKVLLIPIEENNPTAPEYSGTMNAEGHHQEDIPSWDALEFEPTDLACLDDRKLPFSIELDVADESDSSSSPFVFGLEPSKRSRIIRNESCSTSTKRMQRRSNGNSDEWWSPVKQRSSDNGRDANVILETDIEPEPAQRQEQQSENVDEKETTTESRLAQIGTQTSPESLPEDSNPVQMFLGAVAKEGRLSPKSVVRERLANRSRAYKRASSPPPPLPARIAPAPPSPKKHALSPAQAESLRAIFAALLWHEGIVHDAIACAAFLKFHPQLPKHGARVVTRPPHDMKSPRHQRHSVEVSNAGHYLRIQPSTLEALTRSGEEATASRARKVDLDMTIKEEEAQAHGSDHEPMPSVVNVLPPALRALVALWDTLYEADQLTAATDKLRRDFTEGNENDENRPLSIIRKKRDWKNISLYKTPYSVRCELCGGANVPPPLAAHMRHAHPGCRSPTNRGYDRAGVYKRADSPAPVDFPAAACGQLAQAYQLWYIYCEKCREKALKTSSVKQPKTKTISELPERVDFMPDVDHLIMKENAIFLLDLAPLTNSEPISTSPWQDTASRSPPSPPESLWKPAPPFQVLPALGAAPNIYTAVDEARYHSLGRQPPLPFIPLGLFFGVPQPLAFSEVHLPRVHRSVSMGQAGARDLASAVCPPQSRNSHPEPHDTLTGAGSSLLAQPSAALQRLVGCGSWTNAGCVSAFEAPQLDPETLIKSPVLTFVLARRDLLAHRQKLDAAVRINIVRQYAFEALNWLLRSSTQPICVHDVMWWFCTALDKYARIVPPPLVLEDNKENAANDNQRYVIPTASASAICPGGRSARGARAAFHAFLGSVSALAPSLPPSSAAGLQAVRCWALHYSPHDRSFLHRSQVFSVISKILSHSEDGTFEDALQGAIHESYHSYIKENFVWTCPDVTGWCDISVSSRQGMSGALTDGSTETFWESGDEDRNKAKWIQIAFPGGTPDDRPHIVCVHVDNTRDTSNKTLLVSFLYSVGSNDMFHMEDVEVDPKTATWVCYTLPRVSSSSLRIRCEMRGPEPAVRVRQVRVLSAPIPSPQPVATPSNIMYTLTESDTLRVFRLLTSQVFGKLLDWDRSGSEFGAEGAAVVEDGAPADDSDLREHVVGILFAGHKLTSLQRQVMSHIVCAIGCEAARVRDDWETALLCAEAAERTGEIIHEDQHPRPQTHQQDNYCFEMLSLLLALSGSAAGRAHLAQRTELLNDLLALLHTGSERVQRQVISLLRRMIQEITPQKMLAAANLGNELNGRVTLMDHLVCYLSKAITVQVKVKGAGAAQPWSANMGNSVAPVPPATWFMRGETTKKHAHLVAKLLSDIAEEKISHAWGVECRTALANYVVQVSQVTEVDRRPHNCMAAPVIWMALGALCVCEQSHIELAHELTGDGVQTRRDENDTRPFCVNHDDGTTVAVIDCRSCGPLCTECDRFLHLNRHTRTHHRQICKEEESAIRIDIHEGCGRAKLFWLLLLIDRRTLKALAEFRGMENGVCDGHTAGDGPSDGETPGLAGTCRFCGTRGNTGLLAIGNVCADQQCQEYGREACNRVLPCTHLCGGVRGERTCLPCLYGCASGAESAVPLRQDADDMCMICFTDPLQAAPAIQLTCGHVFHLHCCKKVLANKWIGPRITFSFSQCPICKEDMAHWTLDELLAPIKRLKEEVQKKALMRLEYEGLAAPGGARGRAVSDPANYAMERYAYYVCHKCGKAYFGGHARCEAETSGWWEPAELVCGACSDVAGARTCPKHGADFLEYKCRYCCSVAVFFCFGTSHFCNACHDDFQRVTNIPKHFLPQCPAGPKGEQLPGSSEQCPLHVQHPPTGEEFALGCGVCRNAHAF